VGKKFSSFNALKNRLMYKKNERITPQDDLSPSSEDIIGKDDKIVNI